mmetsp:Transcript_6171/g.13333  ORF Transcript_6171/g.13333 Transcript_6171/m.13333 type:complete len:96 (-) Transcript_6171:8-295(-)
MRVCSTVRLSPRRVKSLPKFVLAYEHSRVSGRLAPIVRRGATAFLLSQAQGSTMNQPGSFSWIAGVPFFSRPADVFWSKLSLPSAVGGSFGVAGQ